MSLVIAEADIQCAVWVVNAREPIKGIVAVAGDDAAGIDLSEAVTGSNVGGGGQACVGAVLLKQITQSIVAVGGIQTPGVGDCDQPAQGVVLEFGARTAASLRDKLLANWVAENRAVEVMLADAPAELGELRGEAQLGARTWFWRQRATATEDPALVQIRVAVFPRPIESGLSTDQVPLAEVVSLVSRAP